MSAAASKNSQVCFPLRGDLHEEIGWQSFVRDVASRDPSAVKLIFANRASYDLGDDVMTLLERWEPLTGAVMLYYFVTRKGFNAPSLVVSDGMFSMFIDPKPGEGTKHLDGLPQAILSAANSSLSKRGQQAETMLFPRITHKGPVADNTYGEFVVVHRFLDGVATLRPLRETTKAMSTSLSEWLAEIVG